MNKNKCWPLSNKYDAARRYFLLGLEQHKLENYAEAISLYSSAIAIDSNSVGSYNNRGIARASNLLYKEAISDFNYCISKDPRHPDVYSNLAIAKSKLNYPSEIIILDCNQAIFIDPNNIEAYSIRGIEYGKQGKYKEAVLDFNFALNINPNFSEAYNNRGNIYWKLGQHSQAISDFNQALLINPRYAEAYNNRGSVNLFLGYENQAISDYCMAIPYSMGLLSSKQHYVKISEVLKFREINELNILSIKNRQIWFAHPDTFDDTKDGKYLLHLFPEHEGVKQAVASVIVYSCFGMFLNEAISADITLEKNQKKMWEEYGANGKGFCLYYEYNPALASKAHKFSFDKINYVQTAEKKENTSLYDTLQQGFFTKIHEKYYFENEARFITIAEKSSKLGKTVNESELGFALTKVDFGVLCTLEEDRQKVIDAVNARGGSESIEFYELSYADGDPFKLMRTKLAFG